MSTTIEQAFRSSRPITRAGAGARGGLRLGLYLATVLAVVVWLTAEGAERPAVAALRGAVALLTAMAVSGAGIAVARPWVRDAYAAALAGTAAWLPLLVALRVAVRGVSGWDAGTLVRLAVMALLVGSVSGVVLWRGWHRRP